MIAVRSLHPSILYRLGRDYFEHNVISGESRPIKNEALVRPLRIIETQMEVGLYPAGAIEYLRRHVRASSDPSSDAWGATIYSMSQVIDGCKVYENPVAAKRYANALGNKEIVIGEGWVQATNTIGSGLVKLRWIAETGAKRVTLLGDDDCLHSLLSDDYQVTVIDRDPEVTLRARRSECQTKTLDLRKPLPLALHATADLVVFDTPSDREWLRMFLQRAAYVTTPGGRIICAIHRSCVPLVEEACMPLNLTLVRVSDDQCIRYFSYLMGDLGYRAVLIELQSCGLNPTAQTHFSPGAKG